MAWATWDATEPRSPATASAASAWTASLAASGVGGWSGFADRGERRLLLLLASGWRIRVRVSDRGERLVVLCLLGFVRLAALGELLRRGGAANRDPRPRARKPSADARRPRGRLVSGALLAKLEVGPGELECVAAREENETHAAAVGGEPEPTRQLAGLVESDLVSVV
jgi:hypothetical protein